MITEQDVKSKTIERFWKYIKFGELDDCWEWQGCVTGSNSYGCFSLFNKEGIRRNIGTHRYLYIHLFGEIADKKMLVLHKCDNPICCNPNHLWLGTHRNNMDDKVSKNRQRMGEQINTSKLTEDHVRLIRMRGELGESHRYLGSVFGIKHSSVGKIIRRQNWKHIV